MSFSDEIEEFISSINITPGNAPDDGFDIDDAYRLSSILVKHGVQTVNEWRAVGTKHEHALVHILTCKNRPDLMKTMATQGANINIQRNSDGNTPLHLAIWMKHEELQETLKSLGASLTMKNKYGESPDDKMRQEMAKMQRIIWLDSEWTSLDNPELLEVAIVITEGDLREIEGIPDARGSWVIHKSPEQLQDLSDWHKEHFADRPEGNGLISDVIASKLSLKEVEEEMLLLIKRHCVEKQCVLGGSSIHCDREVLRAHMPELYHYLSHQIVDVSSFTNAIDRWCPDIRAQIPEFKSESESENHRARGDVERSLDLCRWIKDNVFAR